MRGKEKCKALKEIRRQIALENDIPYVVSQCTFQGDCKGTCPKCESELRYLERELAIRQGLGKAVAVVGISASVCGGLTACGPVDMVRNALGISTVETAGDMAMPESGAEPKEPDGGFGEGFGPDQEGAKELPGEGPEAGGQNPSLPGEGPEAGSQNPSLPGEGPEAGSQNPSLPGEEPEAGSQNPSLPGEEPEAGSQELPLPGEGGGVQSVDEELAGAVPIPLPEEPVTGEILPFTDPQEVSGMEIEGDIALPDEGLESSSEGASAPGETAP